MKIGVFGNTNNLPYLLAEELRRQGVGVKLLVNSTSALHRPENLNKSFAKRYPGWVYDVSEISEADVICQALSIKMIFQLLEDVDAVILNHIGPSLAGHFSDKKKIAFLTGSDLDYYASMQTVERRSAQWSESFKATRAAKFEMQVWEDFINGQRAGIRDADFVSYFPKGFMPSSDKLLEEIGVTDEQRISNYFATHTQGFIPPKPKSKVKIFSGARVTWCKNSSDYISPLDYKGTDILLRGYRMLLDQGISNVELSLVRKGLHIEETERLIEELRVKKKIRWLNEMSLDRFNKAVIDSDICCDQFDSSVIGMAGIQAMACGRPLVAKSHNMYWKKINGKEPPVLDAKSPTDICNQLLPLVQSAKRRKEIGKLSAKYVDQYWSARVCAKNCTDKIETLLSKDK